MGWGLGDGLWDLFHVSGMDIWHSGFKYNNGAMTRKHKPGKQKPKTKLNCNSYNLVTDTIENIA